MKEAGVFGVLVPKRWGGPELGLDAQQELVETVSAACMSTGWITCFYTGHNAFASRFSEQAQKDVFANGPVCLMPATTNSLMDVKKVAGGWEISGRATWGSGIMHADWVLVGGDSEDGRHVFLVPASDAGFDDVWFMSGMSGTGSNDIVIEKAFVPQHRGMLMDIFMEGNSEGGLIHNNPVYTMPLMPFIYSEISGVFNGGLKGALDAFDATIRKRVITHSGDAVRERPHNHIQLGAAATASIIADELARGIMRDATYGSLHGMNLEDRLRLKAKTGFFVDHCRHAVNAMINRAGATSFRSDAALQRFFRDINTVAIHAFWDWEVSYEQFGRHRLGLEPNNPLI